MTKLALALIACGTAFVPALSPAPAQAQLSNQTWVSGTGNNDNPCTQEAPCKTIQSAAIRTHVNGTISCLDSALYDIQLSITQSLTVDCHAAHAVIVSCFSLAALIIDIPAGNANDPLRIVRLRGLRLSGGGVKSGGTVGGRCADGDGIKIRGAAVVSIEDVVVTDFGRRGISDERTGGGRLTVTNSILRNNGGSGLIVLPASGQTRIDVAVDNVVAEGNGFGLVFANGAKAMVSRSLIANNVSLGIDAENVSGGSGTEVAVDNSTISNNGTGLFTFGGAVLDVSNSNIAFNAVSGRGPWFSFGNNRVHRNTNAGTLPMAMGAITHDVGQQ